MDKNLLNKSLQDFIFISKYSKQEGTYKETYAEAVSRVMETHYEYLTENFDIKDDKKFLDYYNSASEAYHTQEILGAQRSLQFGGEPMLKHQFRLYNCSSSYIDRIDFFKELFYILLCGAGAGYSVQNVHTKHLPKVKGFSKESGIHKVEDSIEGWATSTDVIIKAFFNEEELPIMDYSGVRDKGAFISGGFKAPGHEPLKKAHDKIIEILSLAVGRKLSNFECHLISCVIADAVIAGGVRRSALIVLFDADDKEMFSCKTGNWFTNHPELARANNSVVILPETSKEVYDNIFKSTKEYGEPGFAFLKSPYHVFNPCFEIGMIPSLKIGDPKYSGWSVCNLIEQNGAKITNEEEFLKSAKNASILGTFQAAYTSFPYLGEVTEEIVKRDALLGVSITGMCENSSVLFDSDIQKKAAKLVVKVNKEVANLIGINPAARATAIKPSGNSSQMLGTLSGIHPGHSNKYIRNVQVNKEEQAGKIYENINPTSVEHSVWSQSGTDNIISFPVEISEDAIVKDDLNAIEFLEKVKITQNNWIKYGTNLDHEVYKSGFAEGLTHNVSNTITVSRSEWDKVKEYLWENKESFCGISMLSSTGDLDYPQAPFIEVVDEVELSERFGVASMLASGLIVDGMNAFNGNLFEACDTAISQITGENKMYSQNLEITPEYISSYIKNKIEENDEGNLEFKSQIDGIMVTDTNAVIASLYNNLDKKLKWVKRFKKFAKNYLSGNYDKTSECLKRVSSLHKWATISRSKKIDWSSIEWEEDYVDVETLSAQGCYGGKCEI